MSEWIEAGNNLLNIDNIDHVERIDKDSIIVYMGSGKKVELTYNLANNLWNYLVSLRVPFYDSTNPTRGFSGL